MANFLLLAIVGLIAQLVDGSLGMAYGVTSQSLLLTIGIAPALASASVHIAEVGTTAASGVSHWRFKNVDWAKVWPLAIPGAIGAFFGAVVLSSFITAEAAEPIVAIFLFGLGVFVLARFSFRRHERPVQIRPISRGFLAPLGLIAGFLDAAGGGMGSNLHADVALFRTYGAAQDHRHRRYQRVPGRPQREHRLPLRPHLRPGPLEGRSGTPGRRRHSSPDSRIHRARPASPHPRHRRWWRHPHHEHEDVPRGRWRQRSARCSDLRRNLGRLDRRSRILVPGQPSGGGNRRRRRGLCEPGGLNPSVIEKNPGPEACSRS